MRRFLDYLNQNSIINIILIGMPSLEDYKHVERLKMRRKGLIKSLFMNVMLPTTEKVYPAGN